MTETNISTARVPQVTVIDPRIPEKAKLRVAAYARVSSDSEDQVNSYIAQVDFYTKHIAGKEDWEMVDIYADEGISARKSMSHRKGLLRLLEDVRQNKIDMILVTKLDRWFRNIKDYNITEEILRENHCYWKTIFENYDSSTANGQMVINIMLSVNQAECDRTSERIKAVFDYKRAKGMCVTGKCAPYGYIIENGYIKKDPATRSIVEDAIQYYFACFSIRHTARYIADKYGENGPSYYKVDKIFHNPKYAGMDKDGKPYCEPYMTMDQYHALLKSRQAKSWSPSGYTYIFSSLITCPICGCKFSGRQRKAVRKNGNAYCDVRYNCMGKFRYHPGASLRESAIEKYLLEHMNSILEAARIDICLEPAGASAKPVRSPQSIQDEINRLNTMYQKGRLSDDYYDQEYIRLTAALSEVSDQKAELQKENLKCVSERFSGDWKIYMRLDNEHKRAFWKQTIEEILVDPETRQIKDVKLLL